MTNVQGQPFEAPAGEAYAHDDTALAYAARHDRAAFAELYRRHLNQVYYYLLARVGDIHEAQDLTAQTFLAALEHIGSYRGMGTFSAWLLVIARHKAYDDFRRRRPTLSLEAASELAALDPPLDRVVTAQLRLEQVAQALPSLVPERAEALALRLFRGLSVPEVAQATLRSR